MRIDSCALAELFDRLDELLFGYTVAFENLGGLATLGHQSEQKVLDRGVLVLEFGGELHCSLNHKRCFAREELVATRHLR